MMPCTLSGSTRYVRPVSSVIDSSVISSMICLPKARTSRGVGELPHGPYPVKLAPLALARVQADVAGSDLIAAQTSGPGTLSGLAPVVGGFPGRVTEVIARDRDHRPNPGRDLAVQAAADPRGQRLLRLPQRRADHPAIIRPSRILLGCSICSLRSLASGASRTRWGWRSRLQASSASHGGELLGIGHRAFPEPQERAHRLAGPPGRPALPVEQPEVGGRDLTCLATQATASSGSSERPDGNRPSAMKNFSHSDKELQPQPRRPVRPVNRLSSSPTNVQCSISSSSSSTRAIASAPPADRQCLHPTNPPPACRRQGDGHARRAWARPSWRYRPLLCGLP